MISGKKHIVAIIGGGVSGSEAALQLSRRGISSVIFEKSSLPYGKIEEGLPKWHIKLRDQEEEKINSKIDNPAVTFVPNVKLGSDISIKQLQQWGFSAILLAIGAWQDRSLPLEGINQYVEKGLYYQNALVSWYNHYHDPDYAGSEYVLSDEAIVIGGGLASLDVVKILMLETVLQRMQEKKIPMDLFTLEREGFPVIFKKFGLSLEKLGLKGCTLYYRRRAVDMPLTPLPPGADEKRIRKAAELRKRILQNYIQKYSFQVEECMVPIDYLTEKDRLNGIVFQKNAYFEGQWKRVADKTISVYSPLVISSIGSIPEKLLEFPLEGDILKIEDQESGKIHGFKNVFALGNVVTGKGNIRESLLHSRAVTRTVVDRLLDPMGEEYIDRIIEDENATGERISRLVEDLQKIPPLSIEVSASLWDRIRDLQNKSGYRGDYREWISKHLPVRLENLMK